MKHGDAAQQSLYQQLLACLRGEWKSLVVVPGGPGVSASTIGAALRDVSDFVRGQPAHLFNTEGLELAGVAKVLDDLQQHQRQGGLSIAVVDPVVVTQSGLPVVMASDAALLVVHLGTTKLSDARATVELVGQSRFIGAVTVESGD